MILFLLLLVLVFCLFLCGDRAVPAGGEREAYLSRHHTSMMNGVFIWLVFLRHFSQYHPTMGGMDAWLLEHDCLGQLIVAPFFFFSGWGMMCSLQKKGKDYVRSLVCIRFPGLLLKFAVAVLVFWAVQSLLGQSYSWEQVLLSLIGWQSLGNSNWFIFMTLLMYLVVAGVFAIIPQNKRSLGVLVVVAVLALVIFKMPGFKMRYWYDTILCLPAGMLWCECCKYFSVKVLRRGGLAAVVLLPAGWWVYDSASELTRGWPVLSCWSGNMLANAGAVLFALGVALLTGSLSLGAPQLNRCGKWLAWCGGPALFYLYIYQRMPMLVGAHFGVHVSSPRCYAAVCVIVTVLIAFALVWITGKRSSISQRSKDGRKLRFF